MKATFHLWILVPALLQMAMASPCSNASEPAVRGVSLQAAETFHYRLSFECISAGAVALYQGILDRQIGLGATGLYHPGRWDIYPFENLIRGDLFVPELAQEDDRLLWVQVARKSTSESVSVIVNGEKIAVSIRGAAKTWRFPQSEKTTVQSLLERCSDKYWSKRSRSSEPREDMGSDPNNE